jgi:DNA polymerase-3 subunit gamma/tau
MAEIMRYIRIFSALTGEIRFSANRRILTEMALIRACRAAMDAGSGDRSGDTLEGLLARVQKLEQRLIENENFMADLVIKGSAPAGSAPPAEQAAEETKKAAREMSSEEKEALRAATPEGIRKIAANWDTLVAKLPEEFAFMKRYLGKGGGHVMKAVRDAEFRIGFDNSIAYGMCSAKTREEDRERLAGYFSQAAGEKLSLVFEALDKTEQNTENEIYLNDLFKWDGKMETEDF